VVFRLEKDLNCNISVRGAHEELCTAETFDKFATLIVQEHLQNCH
jgi:hypothetical protein